MLALITVCACVTVWAAVLAADAVRRTGSFGAWWRGEE